VTILEAGRALRERKISAREIVDQSLAAIERENPRLNAFLTVTEDAARKRAAVLDAELARGLDHGPLHGIPIAQKDCFLTKGVRTTMGSKIFADQVPDEDADAVARLHAAGSVMTGKTNLHEVCYGITSENPHFGAVHNPWDLDRIPGGSSGGSAAAVAAGLVAMATGTDTGGSIRVPASFCGIVGLKPTYGRLSTRGVMPLGFTLDHIGPLTRTVRDSAIAFYAMLGRSGYVPPERVDLQGLRLGVPENFFFDRVQPEVTAAVRHAVQTAAGLGAHVSELRLPDPEPLNTIGRLVLLCELATIWKRYLDRSEDFGRDVLAGIQQGSMIAATDYLDAQRLRRVLAQEFSQIWTQIDCLITPATPTTAPRIGQTTISIGGKDEDVRIASTRFVRPFNVLGWPALVVPCGRDAEKMPIGLQLIGAPGAEDTLFRIAAALE
jgi:aspartyl-tRNA(Asn)/glutamyl-tRNA(Gln) amidotransferase subunit A